MAKRRTARGMALESRINKCNLIYRKMKLALIEKIELSFKITNKGPVPLISTVDYKGMIKQANGKATGIAFDAKETKSKTSFPLKNIESHQLEYLKYVDMVGGESYFLIHFTQVYPDLGFLVPTKFIADCWDNAATGPKSIKIDNFDKAWLVPIDDYLQLLDKKGNT